MPEDVSELAERGYERTDFEMIRTGAQNKYEVPVSTPATFDLGGQMSTATIQHLLSENECTLIDTMEEQTYLSTKVYDSVTSEFFHIKLRGDEVSVFPKDEDFSLETFRRFVSLLEENVAELKLKEESDEE